ncbi:hypothetical protein QQY66_48965 [Streptomyces sp. DG2A-72]|uniref:hypothetical protein n=1 Tax=Streptomyces sp. DG2A-72 TaxID=3051386 RepID=UPI00265C7E3A|nr:hypothetical protein [Streptomyces sp. DG2A-72]MDO0939245.1 hypothetical protein [Streptomyces sp. DG2A-72]
MPVSQSVTAAVPADPADFIGELHAEGAMPQNSGGDPAVPDSAFPDVHTYVVPAA